MKITIYDLLGMIKDGKAPKKIKNANEILEYDGYTIDYIDSDGDGLFNEYAWITELNEEVEILDEPKENKIEKLTDMSFPCPISPNSLILKNKINELIDEVNKLKENKCTK